MARVTDQRVLQFAIEAGMIDFNDVCSRIEMTERKKFLDKHHYWQGKNGLWYVHLPDDTKPSGRRLVKRTTEKSIQDAIVEYEQQIADDPTLEDMFFECYQNKLDRGKISKSSYDRYVQVFKRHYVTFGKQSVKTLTDEELIDFLEKQIPEHKLSSKAFSSLKTITRETLMYCKRKKKYIDWSADLAMQELDVSGRDYYKRFKEDCEEVFDEEETQNIVSYITENPDARNDAILLMFITGMRVGEVVALMHADIDPKNNIVRVRRTETRFKVDHKDTYEIKDSPKSYAGNRDIVVPKYFSQFIQRLFFASADSKYLFEEDGNRITTLLVRKRLYKICSLIGITSKSPHKIRKTYDSILLDAKLDQKFVMRQMGHSSIQASENHYHRDRKKLAQKREIIDGISELRNLV